MKKIKCILGVLSLVPISIVIASCAQQNQNENDDKSYKYLNSDDELTHEEWNDSSIRLILNNGLNLEHAPKELKNNKRVVLRAILNNPLALQFASDKLKDDKKVVYQAVAKNWKTFKFASDRLKNDKDVLDASFENIKPEIYWSKNQIVIIIHEVLWLNPLD